MIVDLSLQRRRAVLAFLLFFVLIASFPKNNDAFQQPPLFTIASTNSVLPHCRRNALLLSRFVTNKDNDSVSSSVVSDKTETDYYEAISRSLDSYKALYATSIGNVSEFWANEARDRLCWYHPFPTELKGSFKEGNVSFFAGGKLNVCYNAIDRHLDSKSNKVAMIWEGDEPTQTRSFTYSQLLDRVCQIANALKSVGVQKGNVVTIYMPMIPDLPMTMLACARIGAVHSVVFAGFSAEALAARVSASRSKFLVTADFGIRAGKKINIKTDIVDKALTKLDCHTILQKVLVFQHDYNNNDSNNYNNYETNTKDVRMNELVEKQRPYCVPEWMDAEDDLFLLYTSGSTGTPKGLVHTTGGYALYAAYTTATTFQLQPDDVFACVADCGWITGHTYVVYGVLLNGGTTVVFESTPNYPNVGRYWDMVQRHKINVFYTAPTAIRSLMRHKFPFGCYDLSTLRVLGTVGEPINPEAWRWYYQNVGNLKCTIVDTYWQTETGGHVVTNIPGVTIMKPGSCAFPMYGIDAVVLDAQNGNVLEGNNVKGVLAIRQPWPGMARTCLGDHSRYMSTYFDPYPGYYFTGDNVYRDEDGYLFITGRCDDVLNVSGHRIGTAEVESALSAHALVAQAAVVGRPHPVKGQSICSFVTLVDGADDEECEDLIQELRMQVRNTIGPFASPEFIVIVPSLPMTRSGKIMRRLLRKIVAGETSDSLGDISTLSDPSVIDCIIEKMTTTTTTTTTNPK